MRQFTWSIALSVAALAVPAAQSADQKPSVFKSGVDLVRFDLSVIDNDGNPVTDIKPDEIQIVEDGKPLPIVLFQRVREPSGFYSDVALRAASAEVTNNDAAPRGHLYVFVFDQEHITPGNEQYAREAAAKFIRTRVRASDRIAVFGIPGPGPDLQFTNDTQRAITELQDVRGGLERTVLTGLGRISMQEAYQVASGDEASANKVMQRIENDLSADVGGTIANEVGAVRGKAEQNFFSEDQSTKIRIIQENARAVVQRDESRTRDFLARLSKLITQFRSVEGRKTLVLFSEGFHQEDLSRDLQDVAAAAASSYCVFYAMDLNRRLMDLQGAGGITTSVETEMQAVTAPLAGLALETDGAYVNDATTHLDEALTRIANQSQDYYIAGFLPSEKALASRGSYRRVDVRVTRPGARVSARTGYTVPSNAIPLDRKTSIDAALAAPFSQQALKVAYTTYVLRSDATGHPRVVLALDADLPLKDEKNSTADVVFVVRDARDGHVVASGTDTMPLPDAPMPGSYLGHSTYRVQFDAPPGSYLMRAVVREPGGLLGSADRRIQVHDVAGPAVAASDLVLASADGALPVRAQAYIGDGLHGGLEVYGRTPDQLSDIAVRVSLEPESGGAAKTIDATLTDTENVTGGTMRRAAFALPLTGVAPGAYVAHATVKEGNEELVTVSRQLDVRGGDAPVVAVAAIDPRNAAQGQIFARAKGEWVTAPPPLAEHATKGFELFRQGNYGSAATELQQAFDSSQKSAATAFVLGWAWEGAGDDRKAIGAWRAAAAADPSLVPAHLALADAYLRLRNPSLAIQALRAGLAAMPDSIELKTKLGQITGR
ncbi:MAG TPA: VWA domain-containing protein [Vicinamibacterales bacterium]|nr:VWA domain-containing protein [Vicinamibacterales bacterium]